MDRRQFIPDLRRVPVFVPVSVLNPMYQYPSHQETAKERNVEDDTIQMDAED